MDESYSDRAERIVRQARRARRRRLLAQFDPDAIADGLAVRELVRSIERMLQVAPHARGRRWPRPGEPRRDLDDGSM